MSRLTLTLALHLQPRRSPAQKSHYLRSCSPDCDATLWVHGAEPAYDPPKTNTAELEPAEPCTACKGPTLRMRLVWRK